MKWLKDCMRYYPVNLDVRNKDCLVVGGGSVGERKATTLMDCGARVVVVTETATKTLRDWASQGLIELKLKACKPSDLDLKFLVIGATNNEETNRRIYREAEARGILCNIADRPRACTFVLPAIVRQGDLVIAVSTSNKSPALAKKIRQQLEKQFGPEYATLLDLMGAIRRKLLAESKSPEANKRKLEQLLDEGFLDMIRQDRTLEVDARLEEVLGRGYTWDTLMKDRRVSGSAESPQLAV